MKKGKIFMSTSATISYRNENGTFSSIYIKQEGFIRAGVGQCLLKNYKNMQAAKELIERGSTECINITNKKIQNTIYEYKTLSDLLFQSAQEYNYYFDEDLSSWLIIDLNDDGDLTAEGIENCIARMNKWDEIREIDYEIIEKTVDIDKLKYKRKGCSRQFASLPKPKII